MALDLMVYTRGSSDDWDRYALVTGNKGWSWAALQPYIQKVIRLILHFNPLVDSNLIRVNISWNLRIITILLANLILHSMVSMDRFSLVSQDTPLVWTAG
jgi:hypothetical protein